MDGITRYVGEPSRKRRLCESRWKLAMYNDHSDPSRRIYELYDLQTDSLEMNNLGDPDIAGHCHQEKLSVMIAKLEKRRSRTKTVPTAFLKFLQ